MENPRLWRIAVALLCLFAVCTTYGGASCEELKAGDRTVAVKHGSLSTVDQPVSLVLQITIDQLRGDQPSRFKSRFGPRGFRYLMDRGTIYSNAHYDHADTETGPGHATLVTGAEPAQHGIVSGEWWSSRLKKEVYSVEDANFPVFPLRKDSKKQIRGEGRGPGNLLSTTIGDEIFLASDERSKIFAVSGKDRSAIIPGGRTGKAFWFHDGGFTTSSYYFKEIPGWVKAWNDKKLADSYQTKTWTLLQDPSTYIRAGRDDMPWEGTLHHLGRTMPKSFANPNLDQFYEGLEQSIASDEMVLAFSKELIAQENLGRHESVDYLSLSFASTDYVGHTWGISSLEAEDNILRVDKNLAELFDYIDKKIGLERTLIVLSADHGTGEVTEYMQTLRFPAKRVDPFDFLKHMNDGLKKRLRVGDNLIRIFIYPYLYLDEDLIAKNKLSLETVERQAAEVALQYPGIEFAACREDILNGRLSSSQLHHVQIMNTFQPERSGHVHLIGGQYVNLVHYPWNKKTGLHGSVWSYDTFVPIFFAGPGIKPQMVARRVGPHDIAPTIANYLGIKPPSGSVGNPLAEVVQTEH